MTEYQRDSLKLKSVEKVRVQKVEGKHRHLLMVGAKHIEFSENFALRLSKAPGDMKDISLISDIINENLHECCVYVFSFKENKHDIVHRHGETVSIRTTLTHKLAQPHPHGHTPRRDARSTRTTRISSLSP